MVENIRKRDGRLDVFDIDKIAGAVFKALQACVDKAELKTAYEIAHLVELRLEEKQTSLPTVELVQDTVEEVLIEQGLVKVAKAYILYRDQRKRARNIKNTIIHSLQGQNDDEVNLFCAFENLMLEASHKTREEDIFLVITMLEEMDLSSEEINEKVQKTFSLTDEQMEKYSI